MERDRLVEPAAIVLPRSGVHDARPALAAVHRHREAHATEARVAVARALVNRPACGLADEPTGNLDENTAESVFGLLMALKAKQSSALVIVTHDARLASRCDRVLELSQGRLRERTG